MKPQRPVRLHPGCPREPWEEVKTAISALGNLRMSDPCETMGPQKTEAPAAEPEERTEEMNIKADQLEGWLEGAGVPEKTYGVLVTDVGRGRQISVEVEARADVVAASVARYLYYSVFGKPQTAIHTSTEVIGDAVTCEDTTYFAQTRGHFRMGV